MQQAVKVWVTGNGQQNSSSLDFLYVDFIYLSRCIEGQELRFKKFLQNV